MAENFVVPTYSEHDLLSDVDSFMTQAFDLTTHSMLDGRKDQSAASFQVYDVVSEHLKQVRFLNFAKEYIEAEKSFLENNDWEVVNEEEGSENTSSNFEVISVPASFGKSVMKSHATKADIKQLRKDIERDQLIVNSRHIIGASVLLDGVVDVIRSVTQEILSESGIHILPQLTSEHLAHAILFKASRTHSGGIVFNTLQGMIDSDKLILVPQSSMSPPIVIHIRLGKFPQEESNTSKTLRVQPWGIVCKISSESFYLVQKLEDMMPAVEDIDSNPVITSSCKGEKYAGKLVSATFEDYVLFDIKYYGNELSNVENIVVERSNSPVVKVRIVIDSEK